MLPNAVRNYCLSNLFSPGCPYQFGIFPSTAGGCAPTYIKCAFGESTSVSCDLGLVFDERIRGCNWSEYFEARLFFIDVNLLYWSL